MKKSFINQKGQVLIIVIAIIAALTVYGVSLLKLTDPELKISKRQINSTKAFYIAEAGIERALHNIKENGGISGFSFVEGNPFGGGTYTISLVATLADNEWTIKSVGNYDNSTRSIQVDVKAENVSIWGNGLFGGSGASGQAINGNVDFRGSVHILGEGLSDTDIALSMSGSANIGNNYEGIASIFSGKYPPLPTTTVNGIENVKTLNATLRIKRGKVLLDGSAKVGDPNDDTNTYKEKVDGVYVSGEITGTEKVHSDNGVGNDYDLGNLAIAFPRMLDPYTDPVTGDEYVTYRAYLEAEGSAPDFIINEISSDVGTFNYSGVSTNGKANSIYWNPATRILEVHGVIIVDSDPPGLDIGKDASDTIYFKGKGTLVSLDDTKDIVIHSHLLSEGVFPNDALGFISANNINIATGGEAQLRVMGAYYAENMISIAKQTQLVGTIVSNDFNMGSQVPKIFQVPTLADSLPPDMPGSESIYYVTINNWREVSD
jgi:Tfp pilus assembly protein PilX